MVGSSEPDGGEWTSNGMGDGLVILTVYYIVVLGCNRLSFHR